MAHYDLIENTSDLVKAFFAQWEVMYHFDQVFSHASQPKKGLFENRHKPIEKFSAFLEREISKILNIKCFDM